RVGEDFEHCFSGRIDRRHDADGFFSHANTDHRRLEKQSQTSAMRAASEASVVLTGVSAGSIYWHVGGTTNSYGRDLRPVTDGLALVPFSNGVLRLGRATGALPSHRIRRSRKRMWRCRSIF